MKCPKCGSENTKKVSVIDERWKAGTERCKDCDYQGDWGEFCDPPIVLAPPAPMKEKIQKLQAAAKRLLYIIEWYIAARKKIHDKYHGEEWWGTNIDYMWTVAPFLLISVDGVLSENIFKIDIFGENIIVEFGWYDDSGQSNDGTIGFPVSHLYMARDDLEHLITSEIKERHKFAEKEAALRQKEKEEAQEKSERKMLARLKEKYEK